MVFQIDLLWLTAFSFFTSLLYSFSTERAMKQVQSTPLNVKEALNNYHCTTYTLSLFCAHRILTGDWSIQGCGVRYWTLNILILHSWANDSVSGYICVHVHCSVGSSYVPLTVQSQVVQWWTVKYPAISSIRPTQVPKDSKQQKNQGHLEKRKNKRHCSLLPAVSIIVSLFLFSYFCLDSNQRWDRGLNNGGMGCNLHSNTHCSNKMSRNIQALSIRIIICNIDKCELL